MSVKLQSSILRASICPFLCSVRRGVGDISDVSCSAMDMSVRFCLVLPIGLPMVRKAAKRQRDAGALAKANMENVMNIVKSLQLKAELEEEKNGMKMFSSLPYESEQNEKDKAEYFRMMRRRYLRRARGREATEKKFSVDGAASDCEAGDDLKSGDDRNEST